ncbi:MAG: hypothetical protein ACE5JO_09305, partial [Candidatus Binatia bacterium]
SNDDIEQLLSMKDCLAVLEETSRDFRNGMAVTGPRRSRIRFRNRQFVLAKQDQQLWGPLQVSYP